MNLIHNTASLNLVSSYTLGSNGSNSRSIIDGTNYDARQPLPIVYSSVRQRLIDGRFNFWVPSEIQMTEDYNQYQNGEITEAEKHLIKTNISYLTIADNVVPDNIISTLLRRVSNNEVRQYLRWIIAEETNHIESYLYILESLGISPSSQGKIFELYSNMPSIIDKVNWNIEASRKVEIERDLKDHVLTSQIIQNLASYFIFEFFYFPLGFTQIFALANQGKMRNMAQQYAYILRDENMHAQHGLFMYKEILESARNDGIFTPAMTNFIGITTRKLINEAVELEIATIKDILPDGGVAGLSSKEYKDYITYLGQVTSHKLLDTPVTMSNPLPWIDAFTLKAEGNFFESTVVEYSKGRKLAF